MTVYGEPRPARYWTRKEVVVVVGCEREIGIWAKRVGGIRQNQEMKVQNQILPNYPNTMPSITNKYHQMPHVPPS
jgi:hypothetical protein